MGRFVLDVVGDMVNPDIGIDHFLADTDIGIDHFLADTDNHSYTNGTNGIYTHIRLQPPKGRIPWSARQ